MRPARLRDFLTVLLGTATLIGAVGTLAAWLLGTAFIERNGAVLFTHGLYLLLLPPMLWAVRRECDCKQFISPKVKQVLDDGVLLVNEAHWLGHRTAVAIYSLEDEIERLVCPGVVINIQSNHLIQIQLVTAEEDPKKFIVDLKAKRSALIIKPGIMT